MVNVAPVKYKNVWLCAFLFGLLTISLLTPIGSFFGTYEYIPANDWIAHNALTIQAKKALMEGQFPIRVAPWEHEGLRYGTFQFYGVTPFTVTGYLYKWLTQTQHAIFTNPFNTIKFILWLVITLGGVYAYRFTRLFISSDITAVLAATVYVFSPYLNINININGAFTEVFAQGFLPFTLFYSFKLLNEKSLKFFDFILSSIGWFILLTSHIITFAYGALFFVLAASLFFIVRLNNFRQFFSAILSMVYGAILAAWFIIPIIMISPFLAASSFVGANGELGLKPTSIFNLFALHSGGNETSPSWPFFYTAIGWPYLFAFVTCLYFVCWPKISRRTVHYKLMLIVSILFVLAVFMTWSWINIWQYLPYYFSIGQFGHRFLVQIMWLGLIAFALAVEAIFGEQLDARHLVIGIFLICFAGSSWIVKPSDGALVDTLVAAPEISHGAVDYLMRPEVLPYNSMTQKELGFIELPLITASENLLLNTSVTVPMSQLSKNSAVVLRGTMLAKTQARVLLMKVNDKVVASKAIKANEKLNWIIPLGEADVGEAKSLELKFEQTPANAGLATNAAGQTSATKRLPMQVQQLILKFNHNVLPLVPVKEIRPLCIQKNNTTLCRVQLNTRSALQLPQLYYPQVLKVLLDGKPVNYDATFYHNPFTINHKAPYDTFLAWTPLSVTTIIVPAGFHQLEVALTGITWANLLTIGAWLFLIAGVFLVTCHYLYRLLIDPKK